MNKSLLLLIIFTCCISFSCNQSEDELSDIAAFKPDDKYFKASLVSLHFIIETSPIMRSDTIFRNIVNGYELPIDAEGCPNGRYIGESPYDAYDYKHIITLEIKDEKIIFADYNEVHRNGTGKQEDSLYCAEMSITGTTPAIAYPQMEKNLINVQNIMAVDGVSGASASRYRFRYATIIALMRARLSN
jgi:major membrane immunogen (membrane-anchored lipoprotein)